VLVQPAAYDEAMALCGVYPLKEAAGCVDGIAHSFFNYVSPADYHTVDWFEWCAPRVWSPTCFRNAFQYGPVSMFNVSKNGRETRVEWLRVSDVRPRALYDVTPTLVSRCMALAEDVQPGCIYAIVSSDWANYIAPPPPPLPAGAKPTLPVWKANTTECFLPIYGIALHNDPTNPVIDVHGSCGVLQKYGAACQIRSKQVVWTSKMFADFCCDEVRCPRKPSTEAEVQVAAIKSSAREHHPDGH